MPSYQISKLDEPSAKILPIFTIQSELLLLTGAAYVPEEILWMTGQCQACPSSSRSLRPNDMHKCPWRALKSCKHGASRKALNLFRKVCPSTAHLSTTIQKMMYLCALCSFVEYVQTSRTSVLAGLASVGHVRIKEALFRNWKVARSTELMEESLKLLDFLRWWEMIFT